VLEAVITLKVVLPAELCSVVWWEDRDMAWEAFNIHTKASPACSHVLPASQVAKDYKCEPLAPSYILGSLFLFM
jgi:hypothetical protein